MKNNSSLKVGGREVSLSHLEKDMFPDVSFTKGDVIDYYIKAAPYLLPHLKNRPITFLRYPDGVEGEFFYSKNAPSHTPDWIKTAVVEHSSKKVNYILINDLPTLVWSSNMANLEMHPLLFRYPKVDVPTHLVLDLDPGPGTDLFDCIELAFRIEELLKTLKLKVFFKVSGSKGMQLHVPLNTKVSFDLTGSFAKSLAQKLERELPDQVVSKMTKSLRTNKILIDWSQNSEFKSTVSVYSLRAKKAIPFVSMPFTQKELRAIYKSKDLEALYYQPEAAIKRMEKQGDLFEEVLSLKQKIGDVQIRALNKTEAVKGRSKESNLLTAYKNKRNFKQTSEPGPKVKVEKGERIFVIQKHAASHLHFDFRLEMQGVLKSWAVPKGPPLVPADRRLAMHVEDHPKDYASFEGIIPEGNYGAGTVMVWDNGTYECESKNPLKDYNSGKLVIKLKGQKLSGTWILIKDKNDERRWLMMMSKSAKVKARGKSLDKSVITKRTLKQIEKDKDKVWKK